MENEIKNFQLVELSINEQIQIDGGVLELLLAACALGAAVYGAGYACGQAYYNYTH
jgi:hypothetical protein